MKYNVFALSITLIVFILTSSSCKVKNNSIAENDQTPALTNVSATDLAYKNNQKLNPDEAEVSVEVKSVGIEGDAVTISAEVVNVMRAGFGFKDILNQGDGITILTQGNTSINSSGKSTLIITKITRPNTDEKTYQLVKVI